MNDSADSIPPHYARANQARVQRLMRFRQSYTANTRHLAGHEWNYYRAGSGGDAVLILPGGGGDAEAMFRYIDTLSGNFTVIAPTIPAKLRTMTETVTALAALLEAEGIEHTHVVGISFGGMLAQVFVRRYPHLSADLILLHSSVPNEKLAERAEMQRSFIRFYPPPLAMGMVRRAARRGVQQAPDPADNEERGFWLAYFDEIYGTRIKRRDMLSRATLTLDYHRNHRFSGDDLRGWSGRTLIVESTEDEVYDEGQRGSLKAAYPEAYVQTLWGYSHLGPLLASDELALSILRFLLHEDPDEL